MNKRHPAGATITRDELLHLQARDTSEEELLANVIAEAHANGWLIAHFRPAKTEKGWRTPVQGDGKGFVDLVLGRNGRALHVELKSERGRLEPDQAAWLNAVGGLLWRPSDYISGRIAAVLA